jgi:tRNA A37 threonylcarbamoyladenosine synthetase subunit TsaC/SUA5/YrdC
LTSANISGKWEIYKTKELRTEFGEYFKKWIIKFMGEELWDLEKTAPSEIFEFDGDSLEQRFLRK